jgi:regulator of nucleoside diphosphate kinase
VILFEVFMSTQPTITITTRDYERLEKLLDSLSAEQYEKVEALADELGRADVVSPQTVPAGVVTMNSRVKFTVLSTKKSFTYTLVYPQDMDGSADKISVLAPVGSALLGLTVGQEIEWTLAENKTTRVRIDSVEYQPEDSGDYHL